MTQFMKYIPSCFKTRDIPMRDNSSFTNVKLNLNRNIFNSFDNETIVETKSEVEDQIPREGYNLRNRSMPNC